MTFGEYIRKHRVDKGLTLRAVAIASGLPSSTISKLERHCLPVLIPEVKDAVAHAYQIEDKDTYYTMAAYYQPNQERIDRDEAISDALKNGATDAEMAVKFGIFICRSKGEKHDGEV